MKLLQIKEIINDALEYRNLSKFEQSFCEDMQARINQYGEKAHISERQLDVIRDIERKIYA